MTGVQTCALPIFNLLLTLHGWRIMVSLVLLFVTLQVPKLFHHKVHVLPQLDLTSYHGVK